MADTDTDNIIPARDETPAWMTPTIFIDICLVIFGCWSGMTYWTISENDLILGPQFPALTNVWVMEFIGFSIFLQLVDIAFCLGIPETRSRWTGYRTTDILRWVGLIVGAIILRRFTHSISTTAKAWELGAEALWYGILPFWILRCLVLGKAVAATPYLNPLTGEYRFHSQRVGAVFFYEWAQYHLADMNIGPRTVELSFDCSTSGIPLVASLTIAYEPSLTRFHVYMKFVQGEKAKGSDAEETLKKQIKANAEQFIQQKLYDKTPEEITSTLLAKEAKAIRGELHGTPQIPDTPLEIDHGVDIISVKFTLAQTKAILEGKEKAQISKMANDEALRLVEGRTDLKLDKLIETVSAQRGLFPKEVKDYNINGAETLDGVVTKLAALVADYMKDKRPPTQTRGNKGMNAGGNRGRRKNRKNP